MAQYNLEFEPILRRGNTVTLFGSAFKDGGEGFRCLAVDALPNYIKDFGALTAATWSTDNEDTALELSTNELAQMRVMVQDDIKLRLNNPGPVTKWRTTSTRFYLPQFPAGSGEDWMKEYMFAQSEFFYWEDSTPRFDLYSTPTATESSVLFTGCRFKLESIPGKGTFELLVDGWPGSR